MSESQPGGERDSAVAAEVDRLVRDTLPRPGDGRTIAFLGAVGAGKTVVAALLKHTLSTKWVPGCRGKWAVLMVSGHDEINDTIRSMKEGDFPPPTIKDEYPALKMEVHKMKGPPSKTVLALRDISGETYFERLSESPPEDADELLLELLKGDGSYVAHAGAYVLMIDCGDANEWDTDKPHAVNAISTIHAIKRGMRGLDANERFTTPIALVFTKADTLPGEHAEKSARELAGMYRDLASTLAILHSGPLACFKVHVDTDPDFNPGADDDEDEECDEGEENGGGDEVGYENGEDGGGASDSTPDARLAVPLVYSSGEYYKLISWLLNPR